MLLVTEMGEEHGLINELPNSNKGDGFKHMKGEDKKKAESKKKDDLRIVKARYINHRGLSERLQRPYCDYSGETIKMYNLIPGYVYDLPKGMVDDVNENAKLPRQPLVEEPGKAPVKRPSERIHELVPISF